MYKESITPGVGVLIMRNAAALECLVVSRKTEPLLWTTPGGSVDEADASPAAAAARELKEETGLVVDPDKLTPVYCGIGTYEKGVFFGQIFVPMEPLEVKIEDLQTEPNTQVAWKPVSILATPRLGAFPTFYRRLLRSIGVINP